MSNILIQGTTTEGDTLIVTGTVEGVPVKGSGWVSRFNQLPTDQRKIDYLKHLLNNGSQVNFTDKVLVQKYLGVALHKRVWMWVCTRSEHILISTGVFVLGSIAQHMFFHYLPQIEHVLHVNLSFLQ